MKYAIKRDYLSDGYLVGVPDRLGYSKEDVCECLMALQSFYEAEIDPASSPTVKSMAAAAEPVFGFQDLGVITDDEGFHVPDYQVLELSILRERLHGQSGEFLSKWLDSEARVTLIQNLEPDVKTARYVLGSDFNSCYVVGTETMCSQSEVQGLVSGITALYRKELHTDRNPSYAGLALALCTYFGFQPCNKAQLGQELSFLLEGVSEDASRHMVWDGTLYGYINCHLEVPFPDDLTAQWAKPEQMKGILDLLKEAE